MAKVSVTLGRVVNLGNYNSLRVEVTEERQFSADDREAVLEELTKDVHRQMARTVKSLSAKYDTSEG